MEGKQLRQFRVLHGLTQADLAKMLQTTGNTVARWERGERSIPPHLELALKGLATELADKERKV
jgi:transcriptional regulator with XRE-family HTH domain